jgi:tetratricopeptide (TPR) repeat protein
LEAFPHDLSTFIDAAIAFVDLGQFQDAKRLLRLADAMWPKSDRVHYYRGLIFLGEDSLAKAQDEFESALRLSRFAAGRADAMLALWAVASSNSRGKESRSVQIRDAVEATAYGLRGSLYCSKFHRVEIAAIAKASEGESTQAVQMLRSAGHATRTPVRFRLPLYRMLQRGNENAFRGLEAVWMELARDGCDVVMPWGPPLEADMT